MKKMGVHINNKQIRYLMTIIGIALLLMSSCAIRHYVKSFTGVANVAVTHHGVKKVSDFTNLSPTDCSVLSMDEQAFVNASPISVDQSLLPLLIATLVIVLLSFPLRNKNLLGANHSHTQTSYPPIFLAYRSLRL